MKKPEIFGIFISLLGGILWGFSGVCGQYLFTQKGISADWLVPYRLLFSGVVLLLFCARKNPENLFKPLLDLALLPRLLIFAILGLMLTQYSYFYSIELSNAAVATVIQYSAPAMIMLLLCISQRRLPKILELISLILASLGVVLLATHGDLSGLVISQKALFYCLLSAVCVCVYNLAPKRLNQKYPILLNLGWGMTIGAIVLSVSLKVWRLDGVNDLDGYLAFLAIVLFGTILAFSFYMLGVSLIGASKASLIACIEPVSAAFFAHFWLKTTFVFLDFVGFFMIISCIFLLSLDGFGHKKDIKNT
ncbi:MAG: EamA family transporter [Campylobacter sp.]|nr:EamA family transporter [Campylobacter sp.]